MTSICIPTLILFMACSFWEPDNWYHGQLVLCHFWHGWTTGTVQLYQGGQLVPSSFSRVDNWDHAIFDMDGQLGPFPILLIYWYHFSSTGVDNSPIIWVTQLSPIVRRTIQSILSKNINVPPYFRKYFSKTRKVTFMNQNRKNKLIHFCIKTN